MEAENNQLHAVDYIILGGVLGISIMIGIYHALTGGRQKTTDEFLLADRKMNPIPVTFSIIATFHSAVYILGVTAEFYIYGYMFWLYGIALIFIGVIVVRFFLPVYFRFNMISTNEVRFFCFYLFTRFLFYLCNISEITRFKRAVVSSIDIMPLCFVLQTIFDETSNDQNFDCKIFQEMNYLS